ncbi:DNA polymerase III subunit delta', partial [Carbonactinospora thermoautotrophica]
VDPAMAGFAARAAQGHIGRAKRLATDEQARQRRAAVLNLPSQLSDVASCLTAAQHLVAAAEEEAKESTEELNARETEELKTALGVGQGGRTPPGAASALKELENRQKKRATRLQRDALDRALVDLASLYRDVLAVQLGASVPLTNEEQRPFVMKLARDSTPEATVRRIQAILACRKAIEANVAPLLAVEAMTLSLRAG